MNTNKLKDIIKNFRIDYIQLPLNIINDKVFISSKRIIKKKKSKYTRDLYFFRVYF